MKNAAKKHYSKKHYSRKNHSVVSTRSSATDNSQGSRDHSQGSRNQLCAASTETTDPNKEPLDPSSHLQETVAHYHRLLDEFDTLNARYVQRSLFIERYEGWMGDHPGNRDMHHVQGIVRQAVKQQESAEAREKSLLTEVGELLWMLRSSWEYRLFYQWGEMRIPKGLIYEGEAFDLHSMVRREEKVSLDTPLVTMYPAASSPRQGVTQAEG